MNLEHGLEDGRCHVKILVVDDSGGMRDHIRRAVEKANAGQHSFVEAENGVEALKKVLIEKPDLVISDWYMPEMSGLALLRAIRANGSKVPFNYYCRYIGRGRNSGDSSRSQLRHSQTVYGSEIRRGSNKALIPIHWRDLRETPSITRSI